MSLAEMSVVIVTDEYETIRTVISRLRHQTARDRLELVIVAPASGRPTLDRADLTGFADVRIVEVASIIPMSVARASGVRAATAPVIFVGETHSFPQAQFAAALMDAHREQWDAVVPGISNANPASPFSWASFLIDYGRWIDRLPAGEIANGPTWNVAYKRSVLRSIDSLDGALSHGDEMAALFVDRGYRTYFEPDAKIDHANIDRAIPWIEQRFLTGQIVAASRASRWRLRRRLFYIIGSPAIPAVILWRIVRPVRLLLRHRALPRGTLALLAIGAIARTIGEIVGYTRGAGPTAQPRVDEYELHKIRFTSLPF